MPTRRKRTRRLISFADFEARQHSDKLTGSSGGAAEPFCPANPPQVPSEYLPLSTRRSVTNPAPSGGIFTYHGLQPDRPRTHSPNPRPRYQADPPSPSIVAIPPISQNRHFSESPPPSFGSDPFVWPSRIFTNLNNPDPVAPPARANLPLLKTDFLTEPRGSADVSFDPQSSRNDMATGFQRMSGDARRYSPQNSSSSSRFENSRPPMNHTLCRNGPQCRKFQEGTCNYNHDFGGSMASNGANMAKKSLNVESPAFTPKSPSTAPAKAFGVSPKVAAAAAFTPRGSGAVTPASKSHSKEPSAEFLPHAFQTATQFNEFVPGQSFVSSHQIDPSALQTTLGQYTDPFLAQQTLQQAIAGLDGTQSQINPYAQAAASVGAGAYFQDAHAFRHPLNYHLYASIGPKRDKMLAYQRASSDFFIPDDLREDLQRKSEASLQTFANSTLPHVVEYFHSLVALDTNNQKGPATFGYPTSVYKATSSKDGHTYVLRRIEGFRLTSEAAIRTIQAWKRINNAGVVQIYDAFTGRWFGDSSLIIVTEYHPLSQTIAEKVFSPTRFSGSNRPNGQLVPENELWGYLVQLTSALTAIHETGLAAQTITPAKILVTAKNRFRVNGCGIHDVVRYEQQRQVAELQRADLEDLGRLILNIAARSIVAHQTPEKSMQLISRTYSERLRSCITWLLSPPTTETAAESPSQTGAPSGDYNIKTLLQNIADKALTAFDNTLQYEDTLTGNLMRELENGRLVRLVTKLNVILERPETSALPSSTTSSSTGSAALNQPSAAWSEVGDRFYLKLFRDYVFHQVDHEGRPVLDLGHIITCLNKLDAGIDEKIQLISRDEQNMFIVSFRDVKRACDAAWTELSKASTANASRR